MNREGYGGTLGPLFDAYDEGLTRSVDFLWRAAELLRPARQIAGGR